MNQCITVWCQRVSKITTDGRHAYLLLQSRMTSGNSMSLTGFCPTLIHYYISHISGLKEWQGGFKKLCCFLCVFFFMKQITGAVYTVVCPCKRQSSQFGQRRSACASSHCQKTKKFACCSLEFLFEVNVGVKVRINFFSCQKETLPRAFK